MNPLALRALLGHRSAVCGLPCRAGTNWRFGKAPTHPWAVSYLPGVQQAVLRVPAFAVLRSTLRLQSDGLWNASSLWRADPRKRPVLLRSTRQGPYGSPVCVHCLQGHLKTGLLDAVRPAAVLSFLSRVSQVHDRAKPLHQARRSKF
jgi:hypothetical protein